MTEVWKQFLTILSARDKNAPAEPIGLLTALKMLHINYFFPFQPRYPQ